MSLESRRLTSCNSSRLSIYILDIDLDAFHTRRAINPEDPSTLYRLIKNALTITIATEAGCVEDLWLDDADKMSSDDLLSDLLAHIDKAL